MSAAVPLLSGLGYQSDIRNGSVTASVRKQSTESGGFYEREEKGSAANLSDHVNGVFQRASSAPLIGRSLWVPFLRRRLDDHCRVLERLRKDLLIVRYGRLNTTRLLRKFLSVTT